MKVSSNDNLNDCCEELFIAKGLYSESEENATNPPFGDLLFDTLNKDELSKIIYKTTGISSFAKASGFLHKNISAINTNLSSYHTEKLSWTPAITNTYKEGDLSIDSISDRHTLSEEGTEMDHCCYSYLSACISGELYLFSIKEDGMRVATLELSTEQYNEADLALSVEQLYSKSNKKVSSKIQSFVERFVEKIESKNIPTNFDITTDNHSLLEGCKSGGLNDYCHLQAVPYHTDASLLSLTYLDKQLSKYHKNLSMEELFKHSGGSFGELFKVSNLKAEYDNLLQLSHENGVSPELIIETKNAHKCVNMDQAITVLQKNKRVTESIKNTSAGLPIDCSPDEQYEQTSKMLSNQYSISLTVSEIAKLNMNNLFEDVTLSLNSKELQNDSDLPEALTPLQAQKNTINMVMRP